MRTVNAKGSATRLSAAVLAASLILLGWAAGASAQVASSDNPAGYIVLPKVVVHTTGGDPAVLPGGVATDTSIQLTNINQAESINVDCWWVNANKHCGSVANPGAICETNADCPLGLQCNQGWAVLDFQVTLTPGQPIGFLASSGLFPIPCDMFDEEGCLAQSAGSVKAVPEDPFVGELKCVQVDENDVPVIENNLKVEASIVSTTATGGAPGVATTAAAYNAVGFEAIEEGTGGTDDPLCLGTLPLGTPPSTDCAASYAPCPSVLHVEHFFDGATTELGGVVTTNLTLVPCSENLGEPAAQSNLSITAQMLVYNEFEQRLSTNTTVSCYLSTQLSDIDTRPGAGDNGFSVFSVGVQGTITGQTRIKGIQGPQGELGYGLIGVACENHSEVFGGPTLATAAYNLQHVGFRDPGDAVYRTQFPAPPPGP